MIVIKPKLPLEENIWFVGDEMHIITEDGQHYMFKNPYPTMIHWPNLDYTHTESVNI